MRTNVRQLLSNANANGWLQYRAFGVLTLVVAVLTAILVLSPNPITQPYIGIVPGTPAGFFKPLIGGIPPLLAIAVLAVVGVAALWFLKTRGWFEIYTSPSLRGIRVAAIIATLFGIEVVIAESTKIFRMPADMNVLPPWSLLFYPVIAYVVEVVFHLVPLLLLLVVLSTLFKNRSALVWLCILLVSLLEPGYQVSGMPFSWAGAYIALHVFAINFFQLYLFRRYDFMTMYALRVIYYLYWHILWGYLRLELLF